MGEGGRTMQVFVLAFHESTTSQSTALLVSSDLGEYEVDESVGSTPRAHLGTCRDGARATGSAALGAWPSQVPMLLGAPIDHIMATGDWEFVDFRVVSELDGQGSDHKALLAGLRRVR